MMIAYFRNLSLMLKLNLVQGVVVLAIIATATALTMTVLRNQLIDKAIEDMSRINHLAVSMFAAFDRGMRNDVERIGSFFV